MRKLTTFPFWRAINNCSNRNMDFIGSPVINVAHLLISWTSSTAQVPPVSMATRWNLCTLASSSYLAILLAAAWFTDASASEAVLQMCDSA